MRIADAALNRKNWRTISWTNEDSYAISLQTDEALLEVGDSLMKKFALALAVLLFFVPVPMVSAQNITLRYGQIRVALERQGLPIGALDTLIATHPLSAQLTLITNNSREFSRAAGLKVEDWTKT